MSFQRKKIKSLFNAVEAAEAKETMFVLEGGFPWLKLHMLWNFGPEGFTNLHLFCFGLI